MPAFSHAAGRRHRRDRRLAEGAANDDAAEARDRTKRRGAGGSGCAPVWATPARLALLDLGQQHRRSASGTASTAFAFMLFAGVLALIMRAQLAVPDNDLVSADFYNQAFTLHGTVMMFLFAVPIFEAVAIFLLPPMLGARDLPFPRLSRLRLLELPDRRRLRLRLDLLRRRAVRAAGSCIRRSPPTGASPASAPTSGCSASPSSRSPRSPPRSSSSSAS